MSTPCPCCPTGPPRCAVVPVLFTGVAETVAQAGWSQQSLAATIDGVTATTLQSGYNSPSGTTPSTTLEVTYTRTPAQDGVRGLLLWNQAGGILTDNDGLGLFTAEFYAGAALLYSTQFQGVNGGQRINLQLPNQVGLDGVDRVVLRSLGKLSTTTVAPLWRELQLMTTKPVWPCRRTGGVLEWYDAAGTLVPAADIVDCPIPVTPYVPCEQTVATSFTNGSFEAPVIAANSFANIANASFPGWDCDKGQVELWRTPFGSGIPGLVPYPDGSQILELAGIPGATTNNLYQTVTVPSAAGNVYWSYRHHQRVGPVEEVRLTLGDNAQPLASHTVVSTDLIPSGDSTWHHLSGVWPKPAGVTAVHMRFTQLQGGQGAGSLLDGVTFVMRTPCP